MNRFPFLMFLKLQSVPRKARAFPGMAVGGLHDHQGTFSRTLPGAPLLYGAGVSTSYSRAERTARSSGGGDPLPKVLPGDRVSAGCGSVPNERTERILWLTNLVSPISSTGAPRTRARGAPRWGQECEGLEVLLSFSESWVNIPGVRQRRGGESKAWGQALACLAGWGRVSPIFKQKVTT